MSKSGYLYHNKSLITGNAFRSIIDKQVGSGIGRMREAMSTASLPPPVFKTDGMFTVILKRAVEKTVEKTVEIILKEMKTNPTVTIKQLSELTGLSRRGIEYNIPVLKEAHKIRRRGSDRSGSWEVIEADE